ncbi:hypothetical protein, partial [Klebsiella pneumoniae]|uniref:hypothetical protein n=1 Tax=Klebsiella pneumoniae TaxID=573 RepID=UPI002DBCE410
LESSLMRSQPFGDTWVNLLFFWSSRRSWASLARSKSISLIRLGDLLSNPEIIAIPHEPLVAQK